MNSGVLRLATMGRFGVISHSSFALAGWWDWSKRTQRAKRVATLTKSSSPSKKQ